MSERCAVASFHCVKCLTLNQTADRRPPAVGGVISCRKCLAMMVIERWGHRPMTRKEYRQLSAEDFMTLDARADKMGLG